MENKNTVITNEVVERFLQGSDPQKYIVAIEAEYTKPKVSLVINDPEKGKYIEEHTFQPFLWFKEDITKMIYEGKRLKILEACQKYDIKIIKLRTNDDNGYVPPRMDSGYKFMARCKKSYNDLINFFREGGVDVFDREVSKLFVMFSPTEQFLIQTGKRLFKGFEDYNDVHRFQFDLETEGLFAQKHAIFQIGVRDNRGIEHVLEVTGDSPQEKRNSERENIEKFFRIIDIIKPDVITGYNSENFDWPFLFDRAERLNIPITELAITLNRLSKIKRKPSTIKLGGETEHYEQTHMYGYNILDISHAVRRAMAINSEIKAWGLKYITQYSEIAKPNRVYIPGDKINSTWADKVNQYAFDDTNGDWYKISENSPLKPNYKIVTGAYLVQRYLCDDLWETEQIDNLYNQASFLIAKILPTSFMRSSTMGTAGQWKLIMAAWSYENNLAIPETQTKRDFTGGLSRLLEVGYSKNVAKLDFAALYPKTQLTWDIFPLLDISGVMKGMLTYVVDTRDKYKFLTGIEKKKAKKLKQKLDENKATLSQKEISELEEEIANHKSLANLYDKKQLPLKILANSWFGSYGAPYIFNWGDTDSAEETTCRGRQSLRLMVRFFKEKYGFTPLVLDTDGCNFRLPSNIDDIKYVAKGSHWKTESDKNKELHGLDAVLAEFNETYMEGRMGLDLDDICNSTINFSRKNYANDIDSKIKLVGNSIKSKKMSVFIEDFLGKAIRLLLDGDGYSFINYYYEYVDKIYNYQIPLVKIATKAKVKASITDYKKKANMTNKNGKPMPKQAHMELAMAQNLDVNLGDVLYYVNTGTAKSHGDIKSEKDKETGKIKVSINCKLIEPSIVEADFEMIKELEMLKKTLLKIDDHNSTQALEINDRIKTINETLFTDDYNVARYLSAFNKKVKPLLVCFRPEIRDNILLDIIKVKDKTTKKSVEKLKDRTIFTKGECELVSGLPFKDADQDSYEELMTMEDKEIKFWDRVNKVPNFMEPETWEHIRNDYHIRMELARIDGINRDKEALEDMLKRLEVKDYDKIIRFGELPLDIFSIVDISVVDEKTILVSRKWQEPLCDFEYIFKYEHLAKERDSFYRLNDYQNKENKYDLWVNYLAENKFISGEQEPQPNEEKILPTPIILTPSITEEKIVKKRTLSENEDEEEEEFTEDEEGNLVRTEEVIQLDDEFDDTFGEKPDNDGLISNQSVKTNDDDWPF